MNYKLIKKLIKDNRYIFEFGQGVSDDWIEKAQRRLNVNFPPSYVWWLKNYNGGEINGEEIFSIYELDFDDVVGGDIVYINELNRREGICSNNQLTIQENDQGDSYYIDLSKIDKDGESPIYVGDIMYAENFIEFINKKSSE